MAADLQTSLLLITTLGALAVGGVLSVTTVEDTVLVSAAKALKLIITKAAAIDASLVICFTKFITSFLGPSHLHNYCQYL